MLTEEEMIGALKEKNIKFEIIKEDKAIRYLKYNSNYYSLIQYCNNFSLYPSPAGVYEGKYIKLDFSYLKDLSILDQLLRNLLFDMVMDIEYYLKLRICNIARNIEIEDGYRVVNLYLKNDYDTDKRVHKSILQKLGKVKYRSIVFKYDLDKDNLLEDIPLWGFMNYITFGELVDFYDFFTKEYELKEDHKYVFILRDVVRLRNCICHNNMVLNDLGVKDNEYPNTYKILYFLNQCLISKEIRQNKLSNSKIRQITSLLYIFNEIVTSESIKKIINKKIKKYFLRIKLHKDFYINNELLQSVYEYFLKIIEKYY